MGAHLGCKHSVQQMLTVNLQLKGTTNIWMAAKTWIISPHVGTIIPKIRIHWTLKYEKYSTDNEPVFQSWSLSDHPVKTCLTFLGNSVRFQTFARGGTLLLQPDWLLLVEGTYEEPPNMSRAKALKEAISGQPQESCSMKVAWWSTRRYWRLWAWNQFLFQIKPNNTYQRTSICWSLISGFLKQLDGVGLVDNTPSTNKLKH